ncbi:MAG: hypothetical protein MUC76_04340 [Spirochaetes bacterium]|nr:hypothetical protein [Spirochaetota bacterium]
MSLLSTRLRNIAVFIYVLLFLLALNLYFNMNYSWEGITLIVRIYIYIFSFYLVFTFSSINIDLFENMYRERFGPSGEQILFLEARVVPLLIIYLVIIVFTLIAGVHRPEWPWAPVIEVLNGRYSNLVVYSLFLLFVLKLRRDPFVTIPLFLGMCVIYFYLDMAVDSFAMGGAIFHILMIGKFIIFFFFLFVEFFARRNPLKLLATAVVISVAAYLLSLAAYRIIFVTSQDLSYQKRESGLQLLRLGFTSPLADLKKQVMQNPDQEFFRTLLLFAREYRVDMDFSEEEWESLLFSGSAGMADLISEHVMNRNLQLSYDRLLAFALEKSGRDESGLQNATSFSRFAARYIRGNETDFKLKIRNSGKDFARWGLAALGEIPGVENVPFLVEYLANTDSALAEIAYTSLQKITRLDPRGNLNRRINDPEVMAAFKVYYLQNRKAR